MSMPATTPSLLPSPSVTVVPWTSITSPSTFGKRLMISSVSTLRLGGAVTGLDGAWALEVATGTKPTRRARTSTRPSREDMAQPASNMDRG